MAKSSLIGRIAFDLVANTGKMVAPLKKAESMIGSFASKAGKMLAVAGPIGAAIAGLGSMAYITAKVANGIGNSFDELGNLSDESKRIGVAAEHLSALQYAAGQAGVEADTLGKALQFMMKKGMNVNELGRIADELNNIEDPVKRMQKALAYFGKAGAGMINVLEGGSEALRDMIKEAEYLGVVVSQKDADAVEKAGDSWARIGKALKGTFNQLAIGLAPYVTLISDGIVAAIADINKALSSSREVIFDAWIYPTGIFLDLMEQTVAMIDTVMVGLLDLLASMPGGAVFAGLAAGARQNIKNISESPSNVDRLREEAAAMRAKFMEGLGKVGGGGGAAAGSIAAGGSIDMSPLLRGSQAALSYILGTNKQDIEKASLEELKGIRKELKDKREVVLEPAAL